MKPLLIVVRAHAWPPDCNAGAEMMLASMLRPLVARGHTCEVWLTWPWGRRDPYVHDGVTVVPWEHGKHHHVEAVRNADVVVTHLDAAPSTIRYAAMTGSPLVQVLHNDFDETTRQEIRDLHTSLLVYNSEWLRDSLGPDPRGMIVRPPVFADDYRTTPGDRATLVNLCGIKGVDMFWHLAQTMPDIPFLGVKGGYAQQHTMDLGNAWVWEHTTDMRSVYGATRVLLMPSRYDSWGRVAVEAMCSGIPVVATDAAWSREAIGSGGVLLDRVDADGWRATVRRLMTDDEAWGDASVTALTRAAELDPAPDLERWCAAVEQLAVDGRRDGAA